MDKDATDEPVLQDATHEEGLLNNIMEFDLKWVHMARSELILKLDGALWLRIIFKPLLTPKRIIKIQNRPNDTSVDPKQQYISRLSKTRMYKTAWQTKEETSARLHSPKSTHVNPEQAQQGYYQMTPDYLLKLAPGDCSPFLAQQSPNVCSLQGLPAAFLRIEEHKKKTEPS